MINLYRDQWDRLLRWLKIGGRVVFIPMGLFSFVLVWVAAGWPGLALAVAVFALAMTISWLYDTAPRRSHNGK